MTGPPVFEVSVLHERLRSYAIAPGEQPVYCHEGVRAATHLPLVFERR